MAIDPARVKALFQAAIGIDDHAERRTFLDRETGDDAELRDRLDVLLAGYDLPPAVLDRPLDIGHQATVAAADASRPTPAEAGVETHMHGPTVSFRNAEGTSILDTVIAGRYKVRQEIGEGGMGSVYLAEQTQPVRRQVALKLIKPGMDSRTVLARFESERQALALMDHPNIAKVLDAGSTEQGRPFFVMELVKGIPLTDYCDQHRLNLPDRLGLFRQICSAVQHAHQKGIIHRDLKPTNILVESHDSRPVPKVIDFGLAKATSGMQLSEHSLFTAFGSVTGTPLYMAPEQATFNALDIDTRADIYALGVILYELLAGSTPIRRETIKRAALDEMLRVIREVEPPTPSSRISTSEGLPSLAAARHVEPARLSRLVKGDLDWIVMKALAKERDRRYDSAIGLANDVERFLNDEPVHAGPPTAAYRLRKFVRRHRVRVAAAALVLLALVAGVIGTTLGLVEARRQRANAVAREAETRKRLGQRDKANEILLSIFAALDPRDGDRGTLPLLDRLGRNLDRATAALEGEATDDPLGVARMQAALGKAQLNLGYAEKAIALFDKARATITARLGPDHSETLASMIMLAEGYQSAGKLDLALPLLEEALALQKAKLGPGHPETLTGMNNLALAYQTAGKLDRALLLHEEVLALQQAKLGPGHPETLTGMNNLAMVYQAAGRLDRALPLYEETLALKKANLGTDHPDTLQGMNNLAAGYQAAGKLDRSLPLLEEALALEKAKLGTNHPLTLTTMNNLALGYKDTGKLDLALPLHEGTLALMKAKFGTDHPLTLTTMNNLAADYRATGKLDRALPLHEEALALQKAKLGPDHPDTLVSMANLAEVYQISGKLDRGLPLLEESLALMKAKFGADHPNTLQSMNNLATGYQAAGKLDLALPLLEETLALRRAKLGPDHPDTLASMNNLAMAYWALKKLDRSIPLLEETLRLRVARSGADHPDTWLARVNLGVNYKDAGRLTEALPLLESAAEASRTIPMIGWVPDQLADAYVRAGRVEQAVALALDLLARKRTATATGPPLARLLAQTGSVLVSARAWSEAEPILRECLAIREHSEPDAWTTFNIRSMLGGALLGQKKADEAEPLLRSGYEGMKARVDKIPLQSKFRLGEALDRLIALAEAQNKPDEARASKEEKAKLPADTTSKPK